MVRRWECERLSIRFGFELFEKNNQNLDLEDRSKKTNWFGKNEQVDELECCPEHGESMNHGVRFINKKSGLISKPESIAGRSVWSYLTTGPNNILHAIWQCAIIDRAPVRTCPI
jgi:hypothetical protein